ncbi:unnamed protein product [Urochloa humidicola]
MEWVSDELAPESNEFLAPEFVELLAPESEDVLPPESAEELLPPGSKKTAVPDSLPPGSETTAVPDSLPPDAFICGGCHLVHEDREAWNRAHSWLWPCACCGLIHLDYWIGSTVDYDDFDCADALNVKRKREEEEVE